MLALMAMRRAKEGMDIVHRGQVRRYEHYSTRPRLDALLFTIRSGHRRIGRPFS
jgi:hypothetical protein